MANELRTVLHGRLGVGVGLDVRYLPARLHNRPERIVDAIDEALADVDDDRHVVIAYADCGTGGLLDEYVERRNARCRATGGAGTIARLPGAHCYEVFARPERFAALHAAEPGTFYLTDFLAKHFDALVWHGLGLADHPELRSMYFGNYRRLVLLSQTGDPAVIAAAVDAAARLGLGFEHVHVGLAGLRTALEAATPVAVGSGR